MAGTVFDIQRFSVHDGPGIRTTVFMKGCPLRCRWCHNPEGFVMAPQVQFFQEACIGCLRCGAERTMSAAPGCPSGALKICGESWEPEALLEQVLLDRDFYGEDGGVTFSGGECLLQPDFVAHMLKLLRKEKISTAIDTCGCVPWEALEKTLGLCDLYLYDVKCADPEKHRQYTGKDNALILENLQKLGRSGARIWIRVPVIPDVNEERAEMEAIARIVSSVSGVERVTLIPYHTLGKSKYRTLGLEPGYDTEKCIPESSMERHRQLFRSYNIPTD